MSTTRRLRADTRLGLTPGGWIAALAIVVIALMEVLPRLGVVDSFSFPPLSKMLVAAGELLADGEFWREHMAATFSAVIIAFIIATVVGVLTGVLLWRFAFLREVFNPWIAIYYAIPTFALYPILVVIAGVGVVPVTILAALLAVVSVITATLDGLDSTPRGVLRLAASLNLNRVQTFTKILFPSAFGQIIVGLRLAVSFSIIGVMASEFILSTRGLGYFIAYAYDHFSLPSMYGAILIVLFVAVGANLLIGALIKRREQRING
jgi:NitT/TauT family transport system permease protein